MDVAMKLFSYLTFRLLCCKRTTFKNLKFAKLDILNQRKIKLKKNEIFVQIFRFGIGAQINFQKLKSSHLFNNF